MEKRTGRHIVILVAGLTGAVPGCDAYSAYRRCGSHGCPEDQRITAEIKALIAVHPELLAPNMVYVRTLDGVVYLSGQVATGLQRSTAEELAHEPQGVRRVVDIISLTYR